MPLSVHTVAASGVVAVLIHPVLALLARSAVLHCTSAEPALLQHFLSLHAFSVAGTATNETSWVTQRLKRSQSSWCSAVPMNDIIG